MNIETKIGELRQVIIDSSLDTAVSFKLFINCEGADYSINHRTPEGLKREGISMRNLKGDFIE